MPAADRSQVLLVHRRGEDVVVEDVGDRRSEVLVVLLVGLGVALLVEVELELRRHQRRVAHLGGALVLRDQDLARRGDDRAAVVVGDVADHQRRAVEPGDPAQRRHVGGDREVAVAVLPVGHLVAGDRIHLHVEGEQVVAALDPLLDHLVEEVLDLDPLPEQPPLHVGEGGYDGVDRPRLALLAEVVEREHPGGAARAAGALDVPCSSGTGAGRGSAGRRRARRLLLDDAHALVELDLADRALVALVHAEHPGEAGAEQDDDRRPAACS